MLMDSSTQKCNLETRLKVINLIFESLDPEKINAAYEGIKFLREKKIRSIMELLKSDYKDKEEYHPKHWVFERKSVYDRHRAAVISGIDTSPPYFIRYCRKSVCRMIFLGFVNHRGLLNQCFGDWHI